jgi:asparagine synthase (glutamine-hydrolysing)
MCGIAGQLRFDDRPVAPALIERMCAAIEHRGPDSRGTHLDGPVGLGIQRLRIIDLHTGDQPVFSEDRSVAVVLNGEIYNFRELRHEQRECVDAPVGTEDLEVAA